MPRPAAELAARLGFAERAGDPLWPQALTHRSTEGLPHYERLEFLGDAVLKLVVSAWLYARRPEMAEGEMTKVRAWVVSDAVLAQAAERLDLGSHVVMGPAEKKGLGKGRLGILASAFEAVLGVVHLLGGLGASERFLAEWLTPEFEAAIASGGQKNHKATLQEYTQKRFKRLPEYRHAALGPEHDRLYAVEVWVEGRHLGTGEGASKKEAEQTAAAQALAALTTENA